MPRPRSWTDEQLAASVAASRTLSEVHQRLGLRAGKYDAMRAHIVRLGLDASHLPCASTESPRKRLSRRDDDLADAVANCASTSAVLRSLGYAPSGGMHRLIIGHIRRLGLDTSHFTGRAWAKGKDLSGRRVLPLDTILVENSTYRPNGRLRSGSSQPG